MGNPAPSAWFLLPWDGNWLRGIPQEGGLEREWVDFDKGCYLGQEVMARIHAMGKVRKQALAVEGGRTREYYTTLLSSCRR